MKTYSLAYCKNLIDTYINEYKGEVSEVREGVLGYGTQLLHSAEGKKTVVINEVYVNHWKSTHTIRKYQKVPKKYEKFQ